MALYDQSGLNQPWYAPASPRTGVNNQQLINQFVWVNNQGTVDMWPVAAGSEMTFIDGEHMLMYVKRVDDFGHPFKTRVFKITEEVDKPEVVESKQSEVNMDEIKTMIDAEVARAVSEKLKEMFSPKMEGAGVNA